MQQAEGRTGVPVCLAVELVRDAVEADLHLWPELLQTLQHPHHPAQRRCLKILLGLGRRLRQAQRRLCSLYELDAVILVALAVPAGGVGVLLPYRGPVLEVDGGVARPGGVRHPGVDPAVQQLQLRREIRPLPAHPPPASGASAAGIARGGWGGLTGRRR
jgi:hypothetical protein